MLVHTTKGIEIHFDALQEDTPVRGNASAIDPETDQKTEDRIIERLESGDIYAWFIAKVWAEKDGVESYPEYLGCCSYEGADDFIQNSGYFKDMAEQVVQNLLEEMAMESDAREIMIVLEGGTVREIYSKQANVKVVIVDVDDQTDEPVHVHYEDAEITTKSFDQIISEKEATFR